MDLNILGPAIVIGTIVGLLITVGVYVWYALALSKLFPKLGVEGWKGWVPVLNEMEILVRGGVPAYSIVFAFIPFVQLYYIYLRIVVAHRIGLLFGRGAGMTVLGALIPPLWATLLAASQPVSGEPLAQRVAGYAPQPGGTVPGAASPFGSVPVPPAHPVPSAPAAFTPPPAEVPSAPALQAPLPPLPPAPPAPPVPPAPPAAVLPPAPPAPPAAAAPPAPPAPPVPPIPPAPPAPPAPPIPPVASEPPALIEPEAPAMITNPWAPHPVAPEVPAVVVPPAPSAAPRPSEATATAIVPPPPAPHTPVPTADAGDDDDYGETIVVERRPQIRYTLQIEGGAALPLTADTVVLGRRPATREPGTQDLAVPDTTRTLSKVHARLQRGDEGWVVTDLESTNGVVIVAADGTETLLERGASAVVTGRFILGKVAMTIREEGAQA